MKNVNYEFNPTISKLTGGTKILNLFKFSDLLLNIGDTHHSFKIGDF